MHDFSVWAPSARTVHLDHGGERVAMERRDDGWWWVASEKAGPGDRYGFSIDGGPTRPDPRSASQPDGVEGLSELIDHSRFPWTDAGWGGLYLPGRVLYELHVGTYTPSGTFDGAVPRLAHLVGLGVDAIEIMPVAAFPGERGWGYDGVDLFAVHPAYGGPDGLKRLVDACHASGLGVVLDVVYNHLGPAGNYLAEFGPYFSPQHRNNWGDAVNLDGPGSDEVRRFFIDNALMWLRDYHIDGLRLDAVHALVDDSAVPFLEELGLEVEALAAHLGRPLFVIAETDLNDPRFVRSRHSGGLGLDAAWADEWHHALHAAFTGERAGYYEDFGPLELLGKALRQAWVYDGAWSTHRQRTHGRRPTGLMGHQFVVFTQNHDQVGNRAAGDRSSSLMSPRRLRIAAALLLTSPFTPLLFQGEEWAASTPWQYFTSFDDDGLGAAVTAGRRQEFAAFGWRAEEVPDPQDPQTFWRSKLDWNELDFETNGDMFRWYQELIHLRKGLPFLTDPRLDRVHVEVDDARQTLVVHRGPIRIAANLGTEAWTAEVATPGELLAASDKGISLTGHGLNLPPDSVAIYWP